MWSMTFASISEDVTWKLQLMWCAPNMPKETCCALSICGTVCPVSSEKPPHLSVQVSCPSSTMLVTTSVHTLCSSDLGLFATLYQGRMGSVKRVFEMPQIPSSCVAHYYWKITRFWTMFGFLDQECSNYVPFPFSSNFSFPLLLVLKKIMGISFKPGPRKIIIPAFYLHLSLTEKSVRRPR